MSSQTNQRIKGSRALLDLMISSRDLVPLLIPPLLMLHRLRKCWFLEAGPALVVRSIQLYPVFCWLYPLGGLERAPVFPVRAVAQSEEEEEPLRPLTTARLMSL